MTIFCWFLVINLVIVISALTVKVLRRKATGNNRTTSRNAAATIPAKSRRWTIQNDILEIGKGCDAVRDHLESIDISIKDVFDLSAILEEMLTYVFSCEFSDQKPQNINIRVRLEKDEVHLELTYRGQGRNPLEIGDIDLTKPLEEITLDGIEILLLRRWADRLDYRHEGGRVVFTAVKKVQTILQS